jgi:hypothetical protein
MKPKREKIALKDVLKRELQDPDFSALFQREKSLSEIARLRRLLTQKSSISVR